MQSLKTIMPVSPPVSRSNELGSWSLVKVRIRSVLDWPGRLACNATALRRLFFTSSAPPWTP